MKLSDYKGEDALDLTAEIWDEVNEIIADEAVKEAFKKQAFRTAIKPILKNHKSAIIRIMAAIDGTDPVEYGKKMTIFTLPLSLIELFSDEQFQLLFTSQSQNEPPISSGSAMESTEEKGN